MKVLDEKTKDELRGNPLSREEADAGYRLMRGVAIGSDFLLLAMAGLIAMLGIDGWQFVLGGAVLTCLVATPLFLFIYRREMAERVRAHEESLGKVTSAPGR